MVQILPQATSLGNEVGQGLRQGLSSGISQGSQVGFQRNLLQNSLKSLENLPPGTTPYQLASKLMQATAGIPGAERYVGQIYPLLLQQLRGDQVNQGQQPQQQFQGQNQQSSQPQGRGQGPFQQTGGYLNPPMNQQQKEQYGERYALGDPAKQIEGLRIANEMSAGSEQVLNDFSNRLVKQGVKQNELPYAMQMAQASNEKNPDKLLTETMRGLEDIRALDNVLVPGFSRGLAQKAHGALGLIPSLVAGGNKREDAIKRFQPVADRMIKQGREPILRNKLAEQGLSATDIEGLVHPLSRSPKVSQAVNALPPASKRNPASNVDTISNFFKDNLDRNSSLLVLRHKLWKDKGYDWKDIATGLQKAISQGLPINPSQGTEMTEFTTQPPRDSLLDIFSNFGRFIDYFRGAK